MSDALWIAAKAPRPGLVKTRLGAEIGDDAAATLYGAFLADVGERFADAPFRCGWYVTPADGFAEVAALAGGNATLLAQPDGSWTDRQRHLFRGAAARAETRTIVVASDSPQLTVGAVEAAFDALDSHEIVLGAVEDGGYYLLGMRGFYDVLAGVRMSTGTVVQEIEDRARALGAALARIASTFDVDEVGDLARLRPLARRRPDLAATHAALEAIA